MHIHLTIPGRPMAKQRPRVLRNGITYTPKETMNYETLVKQLYITEHFRVRLQGPIKVTITAYIPIPKNVSKKKRQLMIDGIIRPEKRPDWDNIGKIITDALNQVAYEDDKQIVDARVTKMYSEEPRVEVELEEIA